jgi:beta-phosphoglucomutase family hydrolase
MKLDIPAGDFEGYIFDLDGTLVDTMPSHYRAWQEALGRVGLKGPLDEEYFYALAGVPSVKVADLLAKHHGLTADAAKVCHEKEEIYKSGAQPLALIEPVVAFARQAAKTRPVSVASGGTHDVVRHTLGCTGLLPLFPVIVGADDVEHGKPAPDMFLLAAKLMGVAPRKCLVFEDGEPGIRAAEAAGMKWVFVSSRGA